MEWLTPVNGVLTDAWFNWAWHNYSMLITACLGFAGTMLKVYAVIHPDNRTNSIVCLLQGLIWGFPGTKKASEPEVGATA